MSSARTRSFAPILSRSIPRSLATAAASGEALVFGASSAAGAAGAAGAGFQFFTSSRVMRPLGPVPGTRAKSIPSSLASFLAAGAATTRSPGALTGAAEAAGAAAAGASGAAAAAGAPPSRALISSSAAAMMATLSSTGTVVPSSTKKWRTTPSVLASMVLVSLSVSTSKNGSPDLISSPTFFSHLLTVPSVMVRPSLGITTTLAITILLVYYH